MKTNGKNVKRYLKCLPNAVAQWSKTVNTHKVNENILHLKNRNTNKHSKKKTRYIKYYTSEILFMQKETDRSARKNVNRIAHTNIGIVE